MADVPDISDIRDIWVDYHLDSLPREKAITLVPEYQKLFEVALKKIKAAAWEEGFEDGLREAVYGKPMPHNPYTRVI